MLETMTKLQTVYLSSGSQGTISFTNIPQNYTDLCVKVSVRSTYASTYYDNMILTFNGSSSGYSFARGIGIGNGISIDGPFVSQGNIYIGEVPAVTATTSTFSNNEIYLPNYSGNTPKQVNVDKTLENTSTTYILGMVVGLWNNTSPINSINLSLASGSFAQFSEVTLYGVKAMRTAVGNSIKATGGAISFDGTYVYHTFNSTDTFTPTTNLLVDYLVVAGGAAGGAGMSGGNGGGGGAGGLRTSVGTSGGGASAQTKISLTSSVSYKATVGSGGAGAKTPGSNSQGGNGTSSSFGGGNLTTITTVGGGGGGASINTGTQSNGVVGGSGGGAAYGWGAYQTGAAGTANEGYAGGNYSSGGQGAGGGGAGGAGGAIVNATGGVGLAVVMPDTTNTYAVGGSGGGTSPAPSANTGSGGSGGTASLNSTAGGSGVVIVRYKA